MIIERIYNNNVVLVRDEKTEKELVLTGCGIGFQKKIGQLADESKIEKKFIAQDEGFRNKIGKLAMEIDEDVFKASSSIIEYAETILKSELYEYIYVALTDHISFALKRYKENIEIKNELLYEIRRIHKAEFRIGLWAIDYINKEFNVNMPEDEAAFIAMHIVNANYNENTSESFLMTKIVKQILDIIRYYYSVEFDQNEMNYERLLTHLKFFAKRLISSESKENKSNELLDIIKIKYEDSYNCALKIKTFIENHYEYIVSEDEMLYLILHINRVIEVIKLEGNNN
ncbi:MAG: BglG family transcription antiterminator LicT [Peptostreptococcaceae bacterium]